MQHSRFSKNVARVCHFVDSSSHDCVLAKDRQELLLLHPEKLALVVVNGAVAMVKNSCSFLGFNVGCPSLAPPVFQAAY